MRSIILTLHLSRYPTSNLTSTCKTSQIQSTLPHKNTSQESRRNPRQPAKNALNSWDLLIVDSIFTTLGRRSR